MFSHLIEPLPPPTTAAALSIRQVRKFPKVQTLQENTRYLRSRKHDFLALGETNVVPVILPPEINPKLFGRQPCSTVFGFLPSGLLPNPASGLPLTPHTQEEMDRLVAGW